jgi:DMSO/TMAO reductase YedYZ molybdopterin-dependent catalytic subunit
MKDREGRVGFQQSPYLEQQGLITPTDLRYIVAQLSMPEPVHPDDWSLSVEGEVERPLALRLDRLQQLPGRTVRVVHECSGSDAQNFEQREGSDPRSLALETAGLGEGLASAGEFTGVPLHTVLEEAGLKPAAVSVLARGFDHGTPGEFATGGASYVPDGIHYEKALPIEKALDADTIVAWAMNGEYLRHVHGAPLRLVVPGWSGNWSVKWLEKLEVLSEMPPLYYQTEYFFYAQSAADERREMITTMGVRCVITHPRRGSAPRALGRQAVWGLAWSGCGRIERVEVSLDGGESWHHAHLEEPRERWLWVRWSHAWEAERPGSYTLMARATDEAGRVQPQTPWNFLRKNFDGIVPLLVEVQ